MGMRQGISGAWMRGQSDISASDQGRSLGIVAEEVRFQPDRLL